MLAGVVLIVDVRRGLEEEEHQLLDFLAALAVPVLVVATKVDKLNRSAQAKALRALAASALPVVAFSAVTGDGVAAVWKRIAEWTAAPKRARGRER